MDQSETDTDSETPMGHASIWVQTHTIYYRPVPENDPCNYACPNSSSKSQTQNASCSGAGHTRKGKGATGKSSGKKKGDDLWSGTESVDNSIHTSVSSVLSSTSDGVAPDPQWPVTSFLTAKLPDYVTVDDPSMQVLNLLRVIHSLNRHWGFLYQLVDYRPILPSHEFINTKLTAKANRQLQVNSGSKG